MIVKKYVGKKTIGIRHFIVRNAMRILTPRLYLRLKNSDTGWVPRPMIEFAQEHFNGQPVVGAEIGVYQGANAKSILQTLNVKTLFLIDPYETYLSRGKLSHRRSALPFAVKNLSDFKDRIKWVKKTSKDAINDFPDGCFDFVYLDGNHAYDFVKKDLQAYWEKIKKGGILGGHDMCGTWLGVCKAVVEFSSETGEAPLGEKSDYWFVKH